jgi:hypothetical protein
MLAALSLIFTSIVYAESPSPLRLGAYNLYSGIYYGNWRSFSGKNSGELPDLSQSIGWNNSVAAGVSERMDLQLNIPIKYAWVGDKAPDTETFLPTMGIGKVGIGSKVLLAQEGGTLPITLSLFSGIRIGSYHAETRGRVTNLGEGTIDVGAGLLAGKIGLIGSAFYWSELSARYWHRFPYSFDKNDYPGDELEFVFEFGRAISSFWGLSLESLGFHRLSGVDYPALEALPELDPDDQWIALKSSQIKVGVKTHLYLSDKTTVFIQGLYSVYAKNNPTDELFLGVGISIFQPDSL